MQTLILTHALITLLCLIQGRMSMHDWFPYSRMKIAKYAHSFFALHSALHIKITTLNEEVYISPKITHCKNVHLCFGANI